MHNMLLMPFVNRLLLFFIVQIRKKYVAKSCNYVYVDDR